MHLKAISNQWQHLEYKNICSCNFHLKEFIIQMKNYLGSKLFLYFWSLHLHLFFLFLPATFSPNLIEGSMKLFSHARILGAGWNTRPGHWQSQSKGCELRVRRQLRGAQVQRSQQQQQKKQRNEVLKGWGKDGNKETWGKSWVMAVLGIFFPGQGIQHDAMPAHWLDRLQCYAADCKTTRTMVFKSVCRGRWKSSQKATWFLENIVLFKDLVGERYMNQSRNWFPIESGLIIHSSSWCEDYGRAKKFKWVPLCLDAIVSRGWMRKVAYFSFIVWFYVLV